MTNYLVVFLKLRNLLIVVVISLRVFVYLVRHDGISMLKNPFFVDRISKYINTLGVFSIQYSVGYAE